MIVPISKCSVLLLSKFKIMFHYLFGGFVLGVMPCTINDYNVRIGNHLLVIISQVPSRNGVFRTVDKSEWDRGLL